MYNLENNQEDPTYNLTPDKPPMPETIAATRSAKAAYGLDGAMSYDEIYQGLTDDKEDSVRAVAAAKVNEQNRQRLGFILGQSNLTPASIAAKFNTDPGSVFEDKYADKYIDGFLNYPGASIDESDNGTFQKAAREDPNGTAAVLDLSKDLLAKRELVHNRLVDAINAKENQSYIGAGVDFVKDIAGITNLYTLRGQVPGNFWLESQRAALAQMPHKEFVQAFNGIMDKLIEANPGAAITFADYVGDPSYLKQINDVAFTTLDAAAVAQAGKAGVQGLRNVLFKREIKRMADEAVERAPLADGAAPIQAVALDAVGHPVEAGKVRMTAEIVNGLRGANDPTQEMVDGISAALRPTGAIASESPTNVGAEAMNRLRESFTNAKTNITQAVLNMSRVLRVNDTLASKEVVDKAYQEIIDRYPGLSGNVTGLMPIKHDQISNKLAVDVILMRNDATPFGSVNEAASFARANGIVVHNIQGHPVDPMGIPTGASIHNIPTGKPAPGSNMSLEDLLSVSAKDPNLSYKTKEGLMRLGGGGLGRPLTKGTGLTEESFKGAAGERVETTKVGGYTAYRPGTNGVFSQGKGFYIAVTRPLNETTDFFRDAITQTDKALKKNTGWLNAVGLGGWRTGSEVLSLKDMTDRQVAIYGPALLKEIISRIEAPVALARSRLRGQNLFEVKQNWGQAKRFEEMMKDAQGMQKDFKDVSELNAYYLTKFKELPSETEVQGYFSYIQGRKIDYVFRNLALHKHMSRVGGEQNQLIKIGSDGKEIKSKSFVGIAHKEIPDIDDNVLIQNEDGKFEVKRADNLLKTARGQEFNDGVKKGEWHLSQMYNSDLNELNEFSGQDRRIRYVLSKQIDRRPLDFTQLPEKEGGHLEYPYDFYLKQARIQSDTEGAITNHYYKGDVTAMALESRAVGTDTQKWLEQVRLGIKNGDIDAAKKAAENLPIGWPELIRKFKSTEFDVNQPFHIVPRGKTIADIDNNFVSMNIPGVSKFKDTSRYGSLAKQFQVEFTGERDAYDVFAMHNEGTIANPALSYRPADLVDPFTSINRSLTRIVDSTYMSDVKIASVEGWVQRAQGLLAATPQEIRDNPYAVFAHSDFKRGELNNPLVRQLEAERYQIKAFAGIPSTLDSWLQSLSQDMADSIYGASNPLKRGSAMVGKWTFDKAVDFPSFLRSVTYRFDIGLFNPAQLLVQSNTYVTIAGLAGFKKAGQGAFAALLHQYSRLPFINDEILEGLDKMAQKVGYRPGEWKELREHLSNSGFEYVGKETNQIMSEGHMSADSIRKTTQGSFLEAGEIFFKGGERNARYGAWYTAGKEYRDLNPTKKLTLADRNSILNRADDLMGNMTKASRSALQNGPLSFPTQFLGYQMRVLELMTGKRLSLGQKFRLFGVYGAAYGLPVATGLLSVLPFSSGIKQYAMEHGYVEGENKIADTAFQGVPAMILQLITHNKFNVGERYGAPGFDLFNDILAGDKSFWKLAGGASGDLVLDTWKKLDPFIKMGVSHVKGENTFNVTGEDLVNLAKGPAIVNSVWRMNIALNSMEWLSRNETPLASGVTPAMAYFMTISGLQPLAVSKLEQYHQAQESQKTKEEKAEASYIVDWRRGLRDLINKDPASASQHFRNADATLAMYGYPQARRDALFARANDRQTLPDKEAWNYWVGGKDITAGEEAWRAQVYGRMQRQKANP